MLISQIVDFVKRRTGEQTHNSILDEINQTYGKLWLLADTPDALQEIDVLPQGDRIVTLPPYVYQVKAVRRGNLEKVNLFTPRPYYNNGAYLQSLYEARVLGRTPLWKSLAKTTQLTFEPKKKLTTPLVVHIQGGGEFGVREYEDLTIGVDDESVTTAAAYNTVTMLSKTSVTPCDIEVYDMNDELVGILLNNQLDAWCLQVQITDKNLQVPTASYNWFSILYKPYAPTFVSDNDSLPDDVGHVLQRAVVAEILRKSTDEGERKRATEFASDSTTIASVTSKADGEGKLMPMDTAPSPYYSRFNGLV